MKFRSGGFWIWRINFTSPRSLFYRNWFLSELYIEALCLIDKIVDVRHPISIIFPSWGLKVIDEKLFRRANDGYSRPVSKNFSTNFKFHLGRKRRRYLWISIFDSRGVILYRKNYKLKNKLIGNVIINEHLSEFELQVFKVFHTFSTFRV